MLNPRLAGRYAKSLIDFAVEKNQLEVIYNDMKYLQEVCKSSRQFVSIMQSPVITDDKKTRILNAVSQGKISDASMVFLHLLITKNREFFLVEIINGVIEQYNTIKEIYKVKLTTATEVSEDVKNTIVNKIKQDTPLKNIELESAVKPELIGGFVLEFNNNLVDASILRDLRDVKYQFDDNQFVHRIR